MNRAERRRAEKAEKKAAKTLNMNISQIIDVKKKATEEALDLAFVLMLALPGMVIHDSFGKLMKKETRMETFVDLVLEQYECFRDGHIALEDLQTLLSVEAKWDVLIEKRLGGGKRII